MRKIAVIIVLVFAAIAMISVSAMAQGEDVLVRPYSWDPATIVYPDQNIVLGVGWAACRRGAIQSFLTATNINWSLVNGTFNLSGEDTNNYWARPYSFPGEDPNNFCMGTIKVGWWTDWRYDIGQLPAGEYTLTFYWWLDHPVTDVADYDGDGRPDFIEGTVGDVETYIRVMDR